MQPDTHAAIAPFTTLGAGLVLMNWWKPVLLLIPFIPWGLIVSRVLDKHAARFNLPREKYNTAHLFVGFAAVLLAIAMPMKGELAFWVGLVLMAGILLADLLVFVNIHNKDERVPEGHKVNLLDFSKYAEARKAKADEKLAGKATLIIRSPDKSIVAVPALETPEFQLRVAAETLYAKAMTARASQVELAPVGKDNQYQSRLLVDGITVAGDTLAGADALKVMDFWKAAAKLDLAERRKKLVGEVTVEQGEFKRKARVTTQGTQAGMRLQMLFDPEKAVQRELKEMGMLQQQQDDLKALLEGKGGMILLAAPPDGGRTTTFYTLLRMADAYTQNVQTIEMDIQGSLEGVRQNKFEAGTDGPEYSTMARTLLRRDPDVLGVAELPDANTAKEVIKADATRIRTIVSVGAVGALQAVQGFVKLSGDPEGSSKHLRGAIGQRLVRKLCTNCKTPYQPSADMLKKLGLPPEQVKQLFRKSGQVVVKDKTQTCTMCDGVGYFGQEGVFEVYPFNDADRHLVKNQDWNNLKLELRKRKMPSIQQAALRKAVDGITSVEEVLRVTQEQAPAPAPAEAGQVVTKPQAAPAPAKTK